MKTGWAPDGFDSWHYFFGNKSCCGRHDRPAGALKRRPPEYIEIHESFFGDIVCWDCSAASHALRAAAAASDKPACPACGHKLQVSATVCENCDTEVITATRVVYSTTEVPE